MQEKDMVNDVLGSLKSSLTNYGTVIGECEDQNLRQTLQQIRNECEHFHYQLFKVAEQKNYYKPAQKASDHQVQQLKSEVTQGNWNVGANTGRTTWNM
ncbi:MAG: Spore coat protein F [Firmicutes bacterium]|nr:Spore coat protein F [Bacillota bacterium]MDI6705256.1 spore coat protein [Bacillota bacterium]